MIAALVQNVVEAFTAPRASARAMIVRRPGFTDSLLMVLGAHALSTLLLVGVLTFGMGAELHGSGPGFGVQIAMTFVTFAIQCAAVYLVGARFGGSGAPGEVIAVLAWHGLATSVLAPLNAPFTEAMATGVVSPMAMLLTIFGGGVWIWTFASFVAEVHGFKRLGPIILATIGFYMILGVLAAMALGVVGGGGAAGGVG